MTELERKAVKESLRYNTKYSEDRDLEKALKNPEKFVNSYDYTLGIVKLLRQKAYRDGYIAGAKELDKENVRLNFLICVLVDEINALWDINEIDDDVRKVLAELYGVKEK